MQRNLESQPVNGSHWEWALTSRVAGAWIFTLIGLLVLASSFTQFVRYKLGYWGLFGFTNLVYVGGEGTVPYVYSTVQLLVAAVLIGVTGNLHRLKGEPWRMWMVLAAGFVYLAIDEACQIHEDFSIKPLERWLGVDGTGYFFYEWIVSAGACVLVAGAAFVPFILRLPRTTRIEFAFSAAFFLGGAFGMEALGGKYAEINGEFEAGTIIYVTIEETLEMIGIGFFVVSMLRYMENHFGTLRFSLARSSGAPAVLPPPPSGGNHEVTLVRSQASRARAEEVSTL
jgi:hypothetical protein